MTMIKQGNLPFQTSAMMNTATFNDYFQRLKALAVTMFEWRGLPELISVRFLEDTLFYYGKAAFINDSALGKMVTKITAAGKLNTYNEPVRYNCFSTGYSKMYEADAIVQIRNNYLMRPTLETIQLYAQRLYEVERAIDVNIKGQKFPMVIKGTPQQKLTLDNIYMKYDGNQPVIMIDKNLDTGVFGVFPTVSPYVADKLMLYKHDLWNEAMTFLGIANANTDKKERLITDEVQANDQLVQMGAEVMLATRQEACKEINKLFGVSVSVDIRKTEMPGSEAESESEPGAEDERGADNE